jgi:hypothetical protein
MMTSQAFVEFSTLYRGQIFFVYSRLVIIVSDAVLVTPQTSRERRQLPRLPSVRGITRVI